MTCLSQTTVPGRSILLHYLKMNTNLSVRVSGVVGVLVLAVALSGCIGGKGTSATVPKLAVATPNTMAVTVDGGPAAATTQTIINHAYVTVKVCVPGSNTQCATIDHVLLDTGSWGLRLVGSVLAANSLVLNAETDALGQTIKECARFAGTQTWGPVTLADVYLAGEVAAKLPIHVLEDPATNPKAPSSCSGSNTITNAVSDLHANGLLGVGVLAQDCGAACVSAATPLSFYYGCTASGVCTKENVALANQVTNPVAMFSTDNNGVIVNLPNLVNANGDITVQGELIFGIATQADNALPASGLAVLGTDSAGKFQTTYNGGTTLLAGQIDSGTDIYVFEDPALPGCTSIDWVGYYCPKPAPQNVFAINTGVGVNNATSTVNFAIADPNTFIPEVPTGKGTAYISLANGGGSPRFIWGMPFFYGKKIYFGINQRVSGTYTGPFFAY